mmetsp:Transcript_65230/g.103361  ORF Transcript_65230/g.103361 Transcript_65230/m.103361 type:complete len:432 (-) Transcript_65230:27-1322(-)
MEYERYSSGLSSAWTPFSGDAHRYENDRSFSSSANVGGYEGNSSLPLSNRLDEENLRREIQQCQRSLIRAQAEALAAEGQAQEAEESHQQELAVFCVQLDALDKHLQAEHQQQSEEGTAARALLQSAHEQMAEMKDELRAAQAETERIETESRLGRPQLHLLSGELERQLRVERALESEVDVLRRAENKLRLDLNARHLQRERLGEHRQFLDESLVRAKEQIESYEEWSEGIHAELRLAGSELREDQILDEQERMRLEARAAELESALSGEATAQDSRGAHSSAYRDPRAESDSVPQPSPDSLTLLEKCDVAMSHAQVQRGGYPQPVAPPLFAKDQAEIVVAPSWPQPISPALIEPQGITVESQGPPSSFGTPSRTVTLAPASSPGFSGAQALARAPSTPSALSSSPTVLWCRKVPSQASLQVSPSVPTLV